MKLKYMAWFVLGAAFATATPFYAHKANLLGYYSCCSWTPLSTLICLAIAGVTYWFGLRRAEP